MKILYVEDDPEAREFVQKALERSGFAVDVVARGREGLERGLTGSYDVIVLDLMLPDLGGIEVLRRLRAAGVETAVLILTALGEVGERVEGLNAGADDYLTKPFAFSELLARIRAVARRGGGGPDDRPLRVADLELDVARHAVERAGRRIELTPKEFALLEYLMRNAGHVVSRTMITERVWGHGFATHDNVIDVHINRLRNKLDRDFEPKLIHTSKGIGYVLEDRGAREA